MTDRKDAIMYVINRLFRYDPVLRVYRFRGGWLGDITRESMDGLIKQAEEGQAMDGHKWP